MATKILKIENRFNTAKLDVQQVFVDVIDRVNSIVQELESMSKRIKELEAKSEKAMQYEKDHNALHMDMAKREGKGKDELEVVRQQINNISTLVAKSVAIIADKKINNAVTVKPASVEFKGEPRPNKISHQLEYGPHGILRGIVSTVIKDD